MGESLSEYELERLANIARNEEKLEALGLNDGQRPVRSRPSPAKKRPRQAAAVAASVALGVRRSTRQRTTTDMYTDEAPFLEPRRVAAPKQPYDGLDDSPPLDDSDFIDHERRAVNVVERPPPEAGSARAIKIDVERLLSTHLGQPMPGAPTKLSAISIITGGRPAKFSKYLGCLEWKNAIVLWVNVGGSDYKNLFFTECAAAADAADATKSAGGKAKAEAAASVAEPSGGMTMTWYASKMYSDESPVVARLVNSAGDEASASVAASSARKGDPVLLFCRLPGEPYVCCGRLQYVSHVPRRSPIKFHWRLLDIHELRGQTAFDALMEEAG